MKVSLKAVSFIVSLLAVKSVLAAGNISTMSAVHNEVKVPGVSQVNIFGTGSCAFRIDWGDGSHTDMPIGGFPRQASHNFTKTGGFWVTAKGVGPGAEVCTGEAKTKVTGVGPVQFKRAVGPAVLIGNPCPPGWKVKVKEPGGALTCVPKPPTQKINCPPKTQYFATECEVGCKPLIY